MAKPDGSNLSRGNECRTESVFTCFSCHHNNGAYCHKNLANYPCIGDMCRAFVYEPGTDEHD